MNYCPLKLLATDEAFLQVPGLKLENSFKMRSLFGGNPRRILKGPERFSFYPPRTWRKQRRFWNSARRRCPMRKSSLLAQREGPFPSCPAAIFPVEPQNAFVWFMALGPKRQFLGRCLAQLLAAWAMWASLRCRSAVQRPREG